MAYDPDPAATHDPALGVPVPVTWLDLINSNFAALGAAWTTFTPAWTGSGSDPAIGNGTIGGAYLQIGKTLHVRYWIKMGSGTTYGTGSWLLALPASLAVSTAFTQTLSAYCYDSSATAWSVASAFVGELASRSTTLVLRAHGSTTDVQSTNPFTWASGDSLGVEGVLEVV